MTQFRYELIGTDPASHARRGRLHTRRGIIETPVFMPVGTQATVKTVEPAEVAATGAQVILANTYHLMLRPGVDVVQAAGGLHEFSRWSGPILTDSGGFQIFSLASQVRVRDEGASFKSHLDGSDWHLTPERAIELQAGYGSDIMMALDHVVGYPASERVMIVAMHRTHRWLDRCVARAAAGDLRPAQGELFGIVQGGMFPVLRTESAQQIAERDVAGCAIGGLSVGEPKDVMAEFIDITIPHLPIHKPRYLMGDCSPEYLWNGVAQGVDMFDCV
jgi:queuine tRNA-ribosyltransferase